MLPDVGSLDFFIIIIIGMVDMLQAKIWGFYL
jgi:hypothetical protein